MTRTSRGLATRDPARIREILAPGSAALPNIEIGEISVGPKLSDTWCPNGVLSREE